jgi:hypothetical protein
VTVVATDDPNDPDGPDSHRNVRNVDFGNVAVVSLAGDYNQDGIVDGSDYIVWRRALGSHVTSFSGADGDGNGIVEQADFNVWRSHYGQTFPGSGSGSVLAAVAAGSGAGADLDAGCIRRKCRYDKRFSEVTSRVDASI